MLLLRRKTPVKVRIACLGLLAAVLLASCAPAEKPNPAPAVIERATGTAASTETPVPSSTAQVTSTVPMLAGTSSAAPLPAATSRGPNLEATNSAAVWLAPGELQFVEVSTFT